MNILHIARITNNPSSGLCVAIPQYVNSQKKYASVNFVNVNNVSITGLDCQKKYNIKNTFLKNSFSGNIDIVVFHGIYSFQFLSIARILKSKGIPYVIIAHGMLTDAAQSIKKHKKRLFNTLFFNRFVNSAVAIQCLSNSELKSTRVCVKKIIGTNGVYIPSAHKEYFHKRIQMVYIGRIDVYIKGMDILVDAVASIHDEMHSAGCTISLYGPDYQNQKNNLQEMIQRRNVEDIIKIKDSVFGMEKQQVLMDADVFIQTSRSEGMPMGILEAMSYGLPCLVTEGTCLGEEIESHNAGWFATCSSESVRDAIRLALRATDYHEKSANARKLIEERYSWEIVSKNTIELYSSIIKEE